MTQPLDSAPLTEARLTVARPWALPADDVLAHLEADAAGLRADDAAVRLEIAGPNRLPEPARKPAIVRFLSHFNDTLIYILLGAAVIKALMGDWLDFWVIMVVAIINAVIGYIQEGRAEKALAGIRGMLSADASARRDGGWVTVPAADLVPGDVVRLMPGDKVPADLRLLQAFQLRVDEAALTGESVPSSKRIDPVATDAGVGDRASMAFSGTIVSAGQGRGVVTATGSDTELGRIQSLADEAETLATPLTRQLDGFGRVLTVVILAMAAVMLMIGRFLHGMPFDELISAAIGFAVAAIPEGLPALVTITLAIGVQQMARHNAITRKLPAVEALGSVTTVCSDKTGTLTRNEMTVRHIVTPLAEYDVSGLGYVPEGDIVLVGGAAAAGAPVSSDAAADPASAGSERAAPASGDRGDLAAILAIATLCNDAHIVRGDDGAWSLVGEPTEGALKVAAMKGGVGSAGGRRVAVIPFDSANKLMATLNEGPRSGGATGEVSRAILVKGAPDRLLERSLTQRGADGAEPLDLARWEDAVAHLSAQGLRVLAAARKPVRPTTDEFALDDLVDLEFLGLWGIVDPPRPEAIAAIADCHTAGIRVKMITGDHAGTALAIAHEMGLAGADAEVLTGAELEALSQEQLREVVRDVDVYARTSPEHKIRIVRALQSHGEVVAMTGDGVNDAPALTRADVGIAMGIKGTEATKEAAEFVLADDNFATIRSAIAEGRRIYDNLRKSIVFLLPTNGAQSLVILVAVVFGLALPLTSVQVLWVNMVTAVTLSLALAYEPAERGIMRRPPRATGGPIIDRGELGFILVVSLLIGGAAMGVFYGVVATGVDLEVARTEAVLMLAFGQLAYLFNCRFLSRSSFTLDVLRGNRAVWWSAIALVVLQLIYTYVPFMNVLFESRPLPAASWILPLVVSAGIFLAVEALKAVLRPRGASSRAAGSLKGGS
ncbi:cation-translocating P-type ATPase [Microbacterium hibisci]|uniref:cation-translocating P-type ATPase n=1 Tax=Microbacterium hibisci TaxID=2036000 RepID=UPI001941EABA|nr:HAD-IC family P-type ATPase [Microbacterium hibisci]